MEIEKENLKCEECGEKNETVEFRPNAYEQDVNNNSKAYWTVCDRCDRENSSNI